MMRTEEPRPVRLSEYRPPDWLVETVDLDVKLHPTQTPVRATLKLKPNPAAARPPRWCSTATGSRSSRSRSTARRSRPTATSRRPDGLTIAQPPHRPFTLEIETLVDPQANTQLSGLYRSSGNYCTQCEAEGFRRITYFPDRPDVMAVYTTRIEADKAEAPVLLANGNLRESGDLPGRPAFRGLARSVAEARLSVRAGRRQARPHRGQLRHRCPAARSRCASMSSPARRTAPATPWIRSSAPCAGTRRRSAANTISTSS